MVQSPVHRAPDFRRPDISAHLSTSEHAGKTLRAEKEPEKQRWGLSWRGKFGAEGL